MAHAGACGFLSALLATCCGLGCDGGLDADALAAVAATASGQTFWAGPRLLRSAAQPLPRSALLLVDPVTGSEVASSDPRVPWHKLRSLAAGTDLAQAICAQFQGFRCATRLHIGPAQALGEPRPQSDIGLGFDLGFDLGEVDWPVRTNAAFADVPERSGAGRAAWPFMIRSLVAPTDFDQADVTTWLTVDEVMQPDETLRALGYRRALMAMLLSLDPATPMQDLEALAGFFAFRDGAERSELSPASEVLMSISMQHDQASGDFLRDAFLAQRQHSLNPYFYRATPTLWSALARMLEASHDGLDVHWRRVNERRALRALGGRCGAEVSNTVRMTTDALMQTEAQAFCVQVQSERNYDVWFRGETMNRWGYAVVEYDAQGRELQAIRPPVRNAVESYIPVRTRGAGHLVFHVTNLGEAPTREVSDHWRRRFVEIPNQNADLQAAMQTPPPFVDALERSYGQREDVAAASVTVRLRSADTGPD